MWRFNTAVGDIAIDVGIILRRDTYIQIVICPWQENRYD
jgi:hypothetical protein